MPCSNKDNKKLIARAIKKKRKELSLSQEELASRLNISTRALSNIENGISFPSLGTSANIKLLTGLDCQSILIKNAKF